MEMPNFRAHHRNLRSLRSICPKSACGPADYAWEAFPPKADCEWVTYVFKKIREEEKKRTSQVFAFETKLRELS